MEGEKRKHKRFDKDFKLSAVKMIPGLRSAVAQEILRRPQKKTANA